MLLSADNFLKFFMEKDTVKKNLSLQLKHIDGSKVKTSDEKAHHFSITKLGKRKKTKNGRTNRICYNKSTTKF